MIVESPASNLEGRDGDGLSTQIIGTGAIEE
jgi:hypothetical protein